MAYSPRRVTRYSEAFKMQLVQELESGKFDSYEHARRTYGIGGTSTVQNWLKTYGRNKLRSRIVRVQKPQEQDQVKKLQAEIKQLKGALAETQIQSLLNKSVYEVLCNELGIDAEAFKKKANMPPLPKRSKCLRKGKK